MCGLPEHTYDELGFLWKTRRDKNIMEEGAERGLEFTEVILVEQR